MLLVEKLGVRYGPKEVISDLTFAAPPGRVTAIVGANGAGKSTILRAIARMVPSTGGRILFKEQDLLLSSARQVNQIGIVYLMQRGGVFCNMSVLDNLALASGDRPTDIEQLSKVPC